MKITAFTQPFSTVVNKIKLDCKVSFPHSEDEDAKRTCLALWDTGAMITCISTRLVKELGLKPIDEEIDIYVANNDVNKSHAYYLQIEFGELVIPFTKVYDLPMSEDKDLIIGMDLMAKGDFTVTHYSDRTVFTFRSPSLESVNYSDELQTFKKCRTLHQFNVSKGLPDKCACGSGRVYKNCHGKSVYAQFDE